MARGYTLYMLDVKLKSTGQKQRIYFFSAKKHQKRGTKTDLPAGYRVGVNGRTGLPYLKKVKKAGKAKARPKPRKVRRKAKKATKRRAKAKKKSSKARRRKR